MGTTQATISNARHANWPEAPRADLGPLGAEPTLPDLSAGFQSVMRNFAQEIMRPIGRELDRMNSPQEVISKSSPFWEYRKQFEKLGITLDAIASMTPDEYKSAFCIIFEELGWGDAGLASSTGAGILPSYIISLVGRYDLLETFPETAIGCWGITEPDHGSNNIDPEGKLFHPHGERRRPNCVAEIKDGSVIIQGQKSAWVSNGPVAEFCLLNCALKTANGYDTERGVCVMVPFNLPGITRGGNLDKMGQRALPQGEIFFDEVEVDISFLLGEPQDYRKLIYLIHSEANALMGSVFTGVARSAFDHARLYAHQRKQGGVPIIKHQDVAKRLFHMARAVEASCGLSRRVIAHNLDHNPPALQAAMFSKVTATQTAHDVASQAIQIFGGNGLTRDYPVEKIYRDARAAMIEDGCNDVLAIKGGYALIDENLF